MGIIAAVIGFFVLGKVGLLWLGAASYFDRAEERSIERDCERERDCGRGRGRGRYYNEP